MMWKVACGVSVRRFSALRKILPWILVSMSVQAENEQKLV